MVSRSLEKMMLIAIGLTTVVLVGVPVLFYSINTMNAASQFENAYFFARRIHIAVSEVDNDNSTIVSFEIVVPPRTSVSSNGNSLTISYQPEVGEDAVWVESYNHTLSLTPPIKSGTFLLTIEIRNGLLVIDFDPL